jgi:hypothetical protein
MIELVIKKSIFILIWLNYENIFDEKYNLNDKFRVF